MASAPETQPLSSTKTKKKKSNHGSHHHHHTTPTGEPVNNVRRSNRKQPRQLEFNQAMRDFKTMFPEMDMDVIEAVLRSNNGAVDATIDQLLSMQSDSPAPAYSSSGFGAIRNEEEPPPYSPPSPNSPFIQTNILSGDKPLPPTPSNILTPAPSNILIGMPSSHPGVTTPYKNWNPPLLGNLPDDFLRIIPAKKQPELISSTLRQRLAQNKERQNTTDKDDVEALQMLEDERVALSLQNQEFLQELQRNPEFLSALEKDYSNAIRQGAVQPFSPSLMQPVMGMQTSRYTEGITGGMGTQTPQEGSAGVSIAVGGAAAGTTNDPVFEAKLSHMGKSTKAKLAQLAKKFNKKKKKRNSRYGQTETGPSSDGLLDEYAEDDTSLLTQRRGRAEENIYSDLQTVRKQVKRPEEEQSLTSDA
ncbi:CUE domain-containing protein 1-like isoform X2 [Anneissia japonica]|uniref:CUE domain-containing protein 1-like isoform X2 n=1 Tax=Anneissia japonica TaxID=1529436 RepID=UPI001425A034|nr:CUE domain-containing protein 1-like isoform X2 [Anneissia japonica]